MKHGLEKRGPSTSLINLGKAIAKRILIYILHIFSIVFLFSENAWEFNATRTDQSFCGFCDLCVTKSIASETKI